MMCLDIYLSKLSREEYKNIQPKIGISKSNSMPLLSWDIFAEGFSKRMDQAKKSTEIMQVKELAEKFNWKNDLNLLFSGAEYEALIITDIDQNIIWVNEGFTTMTGYPKRYAINKTPNFLQGAKTSDTTKKSIRKNIARDKPFKTVITNYKKDRTPYNCEVKIIPLYNQSTTHFIALEKQVI